MAGVEHNAPHIHVGKLLRGGFRVDSGLFGAEIVDVGAGAFFGLANAYRLAGDDLGNLSVRIVHIAGDDRAFGADDDAGGLQADLDAMSAIVALSGGVAVGVDVERIVGAGLHAGFAADAASIIEIDDAISAFVEGLCRANSHAGSIIAVVAAIDKEKAARVRELALFNIFDPGAVDADRDIVLGFASDSAGMAADAFPLVDDECIFHYFLLPSFRSSEFSIPPTTARVGRHEGSAKRERSL